MGIYTERERDREGMFGQRPILLVGWCGSSQSPVLHKLMTDDDRKGGKYGNQLLTEDNKLNTIMVCPEEFVGTMKEQMGHLLGWWMGRKELGDKRKFILVIEVIMFTKEEQKIIRKAQIES